MEFTDDRHAVSFSVEARVCAFSQSIRRFIFSNLMCSGLVTEAPTSNIIGANLSCVVTIMCGKNHSCGCRSARWNEGDAKATCQSGTPAHVVTSHFFLPTSSVRSVPQSPFFWNSEKWTIEFTGRALSDIQGDVCVCGP